MLLAKVKNSLARQQLLLPGEHLLLAVSGGPDSVALCHILFRLRSSFDLKLTVVHVHHGLRGAQADADARFVQDFARQLGLPVVISKLDVGSWQKEHGGSLEMAARTLRYRSLYQVKEELGASKIALGHNADDQAEEVLLRLFRGAGQRGLAGMPVGTPGGVIRPLLECRRHEILAYLESHGLAFREDSSNLEPWCQRNLLRLEWLPRLRRQFNSNLDATLLRTARIFQEENDFWDSLLESWMELHCRPCEGGTICLPIAPLLETHPAMQRRLLLRMLEQVRGHLSGIGFRHTDLLLRLCRTPAASRQLDLPGGVLAEKSYDRLLLSHGQEKPHEFHYEISGPGLHRLPSLDHSLEVECLPASGVSGFSSDPACAIMDRDRISFPLVLRPSRPGDRFRPLGLGGSKKVKDFFIDAKIPRNERCRIPLLCSNDRIVWVVGQRLDDRVKVTAATRNLLRLRYNR